MKKWIILFTLMALLIPYSSLATVNDGERFVLSEQEVSLKARYEFLHEKVILKGKPNGKAQYDATLTRAELAVSLYRLYKLDKSGGKAEFKDTKKHWARNEIRAVTLKGWMEAEKGNKFNPNKKMTIEEVAKVLVKATGLDVNNYASIWLPASDWAQGYMAAVLTEGFLAKEEDYTKKATRSHLIYSLYEVYHFAKAKDGIVAGTLEPKLLVENSTDGNYKWTFTVKNQTEKEQVVNISGSKFDYILRKDGKKIEQYTDGKNFIMLYLETTLKQGEELSFSDEFQQLEKGEYELEIWIIDNNWPNAKAKIKFEVK